ncbi:polysaccharide deacetylase family protein, partial [Streptomyces sp. NPDC059762]
MKKQIAVWAALTAVTLLMTGCTAETPPPAVAPAPGAPPEGGGTAPEPAPAPVAARAAADRQWGVE